MIKSKRAEDKILSMYWFFIIFLVTAAIVYMVSLYYHHPYDVRELEAEILVNHIADCISKEGTMNTNLITQGNFNENFKDIFLDECGINFDTEETWNDEIQYYIGFNVYSGVNINSPVFVSKFGNLNLLPSCELQDQNYEAISKCVTKRFYSTSETKQYLVEITTIVKKSEKNVRVQ